VSDLDFSPSTCHRCRNTIWEGVSATSRCTVKLDTKRLNLEEEVMALTSGIATYQVHRTPGSFEATRRTAVRMKAQAPVVLATHRCTELAIFAEEAPDYWGRVKLSTTRDEKVPF
jgi:hypothetical protein